MSVPFLALGEAYRELRDELAAVASRVLESGQYVLGDELERFEGRFADYVGARHCIGVASGLDALELALRGMGIGDGDEVIVPAHTFIATWLAVSACGARPVPVEPDATFNIDASRVEAAITPRTRAVLPVHLYGQPAAMDAIGEIADRRGLMVVEDAAQAHGARFRGRRVGGLGNAAAWSFYPGKNLGAFGDGGAVTTDDDDLARVIRSLRNYGSTTRYVHDRRGVNSRLDEMQAAFLSVRLAHLDAWNARRAAVAERYLQYLAAETRLVLPLVAAGAEPVWHLFVVRTDRRDALREHLAASGVATLIHYPVPPHAQDAYSDMGITDGDLPITARLHREVVSLPMGPHLASSDVDKVVAAIGDFGG